MDQRRKNRELKISVDWREAGQQAVLQALRDRPAVGVRQLLERVPKDAGVTRHQTLAALRTVIAGGLVVLEIQGATVRLSLPSLQPRRRSIPSTTAIRRGSRPVEARRRRISASAIVGAALLAAGCAAGPTVQTPSAAGPVLTAPKPVVGMEQILDSQAVPQFVACSECAVPTPKTLRVAELQRPTPSPTVGPLVEPVKRDRAAVEARAEAATAVLFAPGSSRLTGSSLKRIDAFAAAARDAQAIYVRGATDATGDPTRNEVLARNRAAVVRAALMSRGVARSAIHIYACTDCFVDSNANDFGRQANRRVDLSFATPSAASRHALKRSRP